MTTEKQQEYQGYRMLTVVVPLNPHHTMQGRQRNMKMHYLMRLRTYRLRCHYYRLAPQQNTALRYGALCFRFKRQFMKEALLSQDWLSELTAKLQAEELCPCVYVYDDGGVGDAEHLGTVRIATRAAIPAAPAISAAVIKDGTNMNPTHVPYFAHQMLIIPAKMPVEALHPSAENYREWFDFSE